MSHITACVLEIPLICLKVSEIERFHCIVMALKRLLFMNLVFTRRLTQKSSDCQFMPHVAAVDNEENFTELFTLIKFSSPIYNSTSYCMELGPTNKPEIYSASYHSCEVDSTWKTIWMPCLWSDRG